MGPQIGPSRRDSVAGTSARDGQRYLEIINHIVTRPDDGASGREDGTGEREKEPRAVLHGLI